MARINIEDSIYQDARFVDLCAKLGGIDIALGAVVRAWSIAQKHYLSPVSSRLIPLAEWKKARLRDEILDCGLAELREQGVYVCGAEEQFAWLIQRQNAGKSKKTRKKKETKAPASSRQRVEAGGNGSKPLPLPLSPSPSPDLIPLASQEANAPVGTRSRAVMGAWCQAFKARYGTNPATEGPPAGASVRIAKLSYPIETLTEMISEYVKLNDPFLIARSHDLTLFVQNMSKVKVKLDTGQTITRKEAQHAETGDYYRNQLARIQRGEV